VSQSLKGSNPYGTTGINTTNGGLYGYRLSMPFGATPDPGTGILINGTPIGLPIVPNTITEVDPPTRRRYADVQGWFGTFIDPTDPANYAKFVTLSHGGANGTNVKPSVAAASFGPQSLLFTGGKNRFYTNRGIGGAFTKVGTIIDSSGPGF